MFSTLKAQQKSGAHVSMPKIFLLTIAHILRCVSMCGLYVFCPFKLFYKHIRSLASAGPHPAAGWTDPCRPSCCQQGALLLPPRWRCDLSAASFRCSLKQAFLCKLGQRWRARAALVRLINGCGDTGFTGICFGAGGAE